MYNEWNHGLNCACVRGDKDSALLMIDKGANDLDSGMIFACHYGHKELVELLIEKGAKRVNKGLIQACTYNQKDTAVIMLENGANINKCWLDLEDHDIYYLVQKNKTYFGGKKRVGNNKYKRIANEFKKSQRLLPYILDIVINNDLTSLILEF